MLTWFFSVLGMLAVAKRFEPKPRQGKPDFSVPREWYAGCDARHAEACRWMQQRGIDRL